MVLRYAVNAYHLIMTAETHDSPQYEILGQLIRQRRQALGVDQAVLAQRLGLGQQTVSRWERGKSRPRRSMLTALARVLSIEEEELVEAGRYRLPPSSVSPPVRPLTRALPLHELTEERFEDLLTEVMRALYPQGHTSGYGGRGHKQHGIDILVAADGTNLATGQCKRHRQFGPAAVREAINEVTISAPKNYLFLSRPTASPQARQEANKYAGWELWDGNDISRYIRDLPRERAVRIVDTYFPGHRESFLGVTAPGPWLFPEEYFDVTRSPLFNHEWSLAGRQNQLTEAANSAYATDTTLSIIIGAGGIGKTRFLKALADAAPPTAQVRLLPGDAPVSAADFELLPSDTSLTVMIDDVHELQDVTRIVSGIWRRNSEARIVLATRPYGRRFLQGELARHGLLPTSSTEVELTDLDIDDATALAREALGSEVSETVVLRLATLTTDFPLVTVVGGVLIKQGKLSPAALEQSDDVQSSILRRFSDVLVNNSLSDDPPTRRRVLDAVSALQPFRTNEQTARESLSVIVGKPYDELYRHLRSLEDAGILRRRGNSLRIVPDLLGDIILTKAAFDEVGFSSTGYLERIEPLVTGSSVEHLFINASRVDQQIHNQSGRGRNLADPLWRSFFRRLKNADMVDRRTLVETLTQVAYFQPERVLEAVHWLIDNPTTELNEENRAWRSILDTDYSRVLRALPPVLKQAALNSEVLPEALTILWELAQKDERPASYHSDHALRALQELAKLESTKPIWFIHQIIDIAITWFSDTQRLSPFEALEPILATEGEDVRFHGHAFRIRSYGLNPQGVERVRQRVIDLAFEEIRSPNLRRSGAAVRFLESALRYPRGSFGDAVPKKTREEWTPGFVETITRLGSIAASDELDPAVLVSIRKVLHRQANYGTGPAHDAAEKVVNSLPKTTESNVALALHDGWGGLVRDRDDDYKTVEAKGRAVLQTAIDDLAGMTDDEVVDLLIVRLQADREVHGSTESNPHPFLANLIEARPSIAPTILSILETPSSPVFDPVLPIILGAFATVDPPAALEWIRNLIANGSEERRRSAAQALGWSRGRRDLHPGELDLLLQLAGDPDCLIRRNIARAAQLLAPGNTAAATRIFAALRFSDDPQLADDIFVAFGKTFGISWSNFSDPELEFIRQDLITVPRIDTYWVINALANRSATDPAWVIELLQHRVERAETMEGIRKYVALPFSWEPQLQVRDSAAFLPSLHRILKWVAEVHDSNMNREQRAELFAAVANGYDAQVIQLLTDALAVGAKDLTLAVVAVLSKAPRTFIWDHPDFVSTALHAADLLSKDILTRLTSALWSATSLGSRSGTPGEPFPESIEQRERSQAIAHNLPFGSIEQRFYTDMAKDAEQDILRDRELDLPTDGRTW